MKAGRKKKQKAIGEVVKAESDGGSAPRNLMPETAKRRTNQPHTKTGKKREGAQLFLQGGKSS